MHPVTRFAPSPTGYLHVGNAYSALLCQQWAERHGARILLRIEDVDFNRCSEQFTDAIIGDLAWLGIRWHGDIRRQSEHVSTYRAALEDLYERGVIYPCFCTRRQIQKEVERMGIAPHAEDVAIPYSGRCRDLSPEKQRMCMAGQRFAWRLNVAAALKQVDEKLVWRDGDGRHHPVQINTHGDAVIGRKDIGISYHLAVVMDDAAQGITHVIRGEDLQSCTGLHRLLQALLDLPSPVYIHHPLLRNEKGHRLAKRYGAPSLHELRQAGVSPQRLRRTLLTTEDGVWHREKALGKDVIITQHLL